MGVTRGAGTANPSRAPEFSPDFNVICVAQPLYFFAMFCRSLFVLFLYAIMLSVLPSFVCLFVFKKKILFIFVFIILWSSLPSKINCLNVLFFWFFFVGFCFVWFCFLLCVAFFELVSIQFTIYHESRKWVIKSRKSKEKGQIMIYKTLHRYHDYYKNSGWIQVLLNGTLFLLITLDFVDKRKKK